jgi:hypothetical protein
VNRVSLSATTKGERLALAAAGVWAPSMPPSSNESSTTRRHNTDALSVDIDVAKLERLDTFGAWLIERLKLTFVLRGSTARIVGLSDAESSGWSMRRPKPVAVCSCDIHDNSRSHDESLNCFGRFGNRPNESDH